MGINWHDPVLVQQDLLTFVKFLHCVDGLYIWEYFTTLKYEWEVINGKRPYRWTIWVYSVSRLSALITVVVNLIGFNVVHEINCQVWVVFQLIFAYLSFATASLLIVLRVVAIWNRNRIASGLAAATWLVNVGFLIHGIVEIRAVWEPAAATCLLLNTDSSKSNIIVTLATDFTLCSLMVVGLFHGKKNQSADGIWRLLYRQGIIWLFMATIALVPPAVFIALNLNDPWNLMFDTPSLIAMEICATRMYRTLTDFGRAGISDLSSNSNGPVTSIGGGGRFGRPNVTNASIIPMSRMEVSVHTDYENFGAPDGIADADKPRRLSSEVGTVDLRGKRDG